MRRVLAAALICLLLAGCGKTDKDLTLDMEALCNELLEGGVFEETLYPAEESAVPLLLDFETECEGLVYVGTGATAEELAVFETASAGDAQELLERLWERNESRIADYGSYLPDEVPKLENSLILAEGRFVLLCTAQDSSGARQLWKATFGG